MKTPCLVGEAEKGGARACGSKEQWRESRFFRAVFAFIYFGGVVSISKDLFGRADEQPWWGVSLTLLIAAAAARHAWRNFRIYERDS